MPLFQFQELSKRNVHWNFIGVAQIKGNKILPHVYTYYLTTVTIREANYTAGQEKFTPNQVCLKLYFMVIK